MLVGLELYPASGSATVLDWGYYRIIYKILIYFEIILAQYDYSDK